MVCDPCSSPQRLIQVVASAFHLPVTSYSTSPGFRMMICIAGTIINPLSYYVYRNMNFEEPPMSQVGWAVVYDVSPTRVNLAKILGKVAALEWPGCPTALENLTTYRVSRA